MACAGKYELLKVNQVVGETTKSFRLKEDVSLAKEPKAESVLTVQGTGKIDRVEVISGRVVVEGVVNVRLTYVACIPNRPVHAAHLLIPFTDVVEIAAATPGMSAYVVPSVEEITLEPKEMCTRDFEATVDLKLLVKVTQLKEVEVLVDPPPGLTAQKKKLRVEDVIASAVRQVVARGRCTVPHKKPAVEEILDVMTETEVTRAVTRKDEVVVEGKLHAYVVYVAGTASGPVHQVHCTIPFTEIVAVEGITGTMTAQVLTQAVTAKVEPEQVPSRTLVVESVLTFKVLVGELKQLEVVTEVSGAARVTKTKLRVEMVVGEKTGEVVLSGAVKPPPVDPPAEKVLAAEPVGVTIAETEVVDGLVVSRGHLDVRVVYGAATPDQGVYAADARLVFTASTPVEGARPGCNVYVLPTVDYVTARVKDGEIIVEAVVAVLIKVTEAVQQDVITCVEVAPAPPAPPGPPPCPPGQVIRYTIRPGDTFYKLAQRYGTTVEAIMTANPGVDPYNLQIGQVITIPCNAADPR
ncbi:MAG: SPOCS domain-containing protein [Bacillota bacterium]